MQFGQRIICWHLSLTRLYCHYDVLTIDCNRVFSYLCSLCEFCMLLKHLSYELDIGILYICDMNCTFWERSNSMCIKRNVEKMFLFFVISGIYSLTFSVWTDQHSSARIIKGIVYFPYEGIRKLKFKCLTVMMSFYTNLSQICYTRSGRIL